MSARATEAPPAWTASADTMLRDVSRRVSAITSATPTNLRDDAARITASWSRGDETNPEPTYAPPRDVGELGPALRKLEAELERRDALGRLYAERCRELALEVDLVASVGRVGFSELVAARFDPAAPFVERADALARGWIDEPVLEDDSPVVVSSDDHDPRSLVSVVRRGIGARRLGARVVVLENLAPLAAVGDGVVQIARDRSLTARDAERTAMHELDGHLVPQARARVEALGIFAFGTRCGSDDQEGRALSLERAGGYLLGPRRVELARRHLAARAVRDGSHFIETTRLLISLGGSVLDSVRVSLRVHRGCRDGVGGLAREVVYLPSLLAVEELVARDPEADDVLSRGRVGVAAVAVLRPYVSAPP